MYYTYLVRCSDGTLYCGYAANPYEREKVHNSGKGAKYTRTRLPVKLVYTEAFETKQEAMSREFKIKRLTRQQKLNLIKNNSSK